MKKNAGKASNGADAGTGSGRPSAERFYSAQPSTIEFSDPSAYVNTQLMSLLSQ